MCGRYLFVVIEVFTVGGGEYLVNTFNAVAVASTTFDRDVIEVSGKPVIAGQTVEAIGSTTGRTAVC